MKEMESNIQRRVEVLRTEYEAASNIPLSVKFAGTLTAETMAKVVPALVAEDFASKPFGHHAVVDVANGLRVFATKAFRADWFNVNDRVGWINSDPTPLISDLIDKKSEKLPKYRGRWSGYAPSDSSGSYLQQWKIDARGLPFVEPARISGRIFLFLS
jgi:hypothetical protein